MKLAKIRVRGILHEIPRRDQAAERVLWNTSWDDVDVVEPGHRNPFVRRATPLHALPDVPPDEPVRVRGRVLEDPVDGIFPIGIQPSPTQPRVRAWKQGGPPVRRGDTVDLLGFNREIDGEDRLEVVDLQLLGLPGGFDPQGKEFPALSNYVACADSVAAIRSLNPEQVKARWPVRINGMANYRDREKSSFYLQRDSGGVLVHWNGTNETPAIGQPIRLHGHVVPGVRHPEIAGTSFELLTLRPPQQPRLIPVSTFMAGALTGGRLQMRGIVRSASAGRESNSAQLRIEWDGSFVRARMNLAGEDMPTNWVDARVDVTGIAHPEKVSRNSYPEEVILISEPKDVRILDPAPEEPFAGEVWPIGDILWQSWREPGVRRLMVRGVLTATQPIYMLDDGTGGIQIRQPAGPEFQLGDEIEVVGFPRWSRNAPRLSDVIMRRIGPGKLPTPEPTNARQITAADFNGRRVVLPGRVTGHSGETLDLRADGVAFSAIVPGSEKSHWPEGSTVEVIGVCQFFGGGSDAFPESFRLLLPGPESVTVTHFPTE